MRRLFAALLASLIIAGLIAPAVGAAPIAAAAGAAAVPKVVIVVGPSGAATDRYRAEARKAAKLARTYTPDVTEVYSPNATWPAVKAALQGASLVVYMGHGNGWPSRYRDSLYPPTQNGFGLNPKAGGGDHAHQYFGEGKIADSIKLAKNAVVLLNHLCYASGNSEPGLAEGTLAQARQRVDNFAAGFIKAGAAAVIAEAYASPNHMITSILGRSKSVEAAWRGAPSRNGNAFAFESTRSPGFIAQMDPEKADSGFSRSIVLKAGLASADVLRNARGSAAASAARIDASDLAPSLAAARIKAKDPTLAATTAGTTIGYKVPYTVGNRKALPKTILASVRWDALDPVASDPAAETTAPAAAAPAPAPTQVPAESAAPAASEAPDANAAAAASAAPSAGSEATAAPSQAAPDPAPTARTAPDLGLVTAERLGDVVAPVKVKLSKKSFSFKITAPETPGRYRLTVTLHDADGVAFDAMTQAMLPTLIVRVTGELDATIVAPSSTELAPGAAASLPLWVANLGVAAWGHRTVADAKDPEGSAPATAARLTAMWVALGGLDDADQLAAAAAAPTAIVDLPAGLKPGAVVPAELGIFAPTVAGDYLLILDVLTPEHGSLVAAGVEATIIRVRVAETETQAPVAPETTPVAPSDPAGDAIGSTPGPAVTTSDVTTPPAAQ